MKILTKVMISLFALFCLQAVTVAQAAEYEALDGVSSAKAIFDVRIGQPQSAALHLKLIHQTYKDLAMAKKNPKFALVFIGPSVKLISMNRGEFKTEDQQSLDEIASAVSDMKKDGIKIEVCGVALKVFKVDPASVLPEIKKVENGWISEIGYQARGYSLVPAY